MDVDALNTLEAYDARKENDDAVQTRTRTRSLLAVVARASVCWTQRGCGWQVGSGTQASGREREVGYGVSGVGGLAGERKEVGREKGSGRHTIPGFLFSFYF